MKHFLAFAFALILTGAASLPAAAQAKDDINEQARLLALTPEEYRSLNEEQREGLRAGYILFEFCDIKDGQIKVSLTEEEAVKKGVSAKGYRVFMQGIEETNTGLARAKQEGQTDFDYPDLKQISRNYRAYLDGKMSLNEFKASLSGRH